MLRVSQKFINAVFIGACCVGWGLSSQALAQSDNQIVLGSGAVSGVYYPAGGAICRLVNREAQRLDKGQNKLNCQVVSTKGSDNNIKLLHQKKLNFALVQSDVHYRAYNGDGVYRDVGAATGLRSVFSLHTEAFTLVARADSNINSFDQLRGTRVNLGAAGSGQLSTMQELISLRGYNLDNFVQAASFPSDQMSAALCDNKIDALVYLVGHPSSAIKEATSRCKSKIVPMQAEFVEQLTSKYPYYRAATIKAGEYNNNPQAIPTFGVAATLVTSVDTPDEQVYQLTKAVFENFAAFMRLNPAFAELDKQQMFSTGLTAPLHPGARRYYREAGLLK